MISTFDLARIVPRFILNDKNGYAIAKAMETALQFFLEKSQEGLDALMDVDKMPEWRLDEMAWECGCLYDEHAEIEQKREWIRDAIPLYSIWGTKKGVAEYLKGYFGEIEVEENWQYGGSPFHFRITVGGEWTPENEAWARRAVERAKNIRSVMDDIRVGTRAFLGIKATGDIKDRFRYPSAGEIAAGEYPTENIKWIIDTTRKDAIRVEDTEGRTEWDMAGEKPEINHLLAIGNENMSYLATAEDGRITYPNAGETDAGTLPEVNHLLSLDNTPMQGDEAEEIVTTIYYPLCGEIISGE